MTDKYIDFDEYRKEKKQEPLIIKAFGEEYELPPSPKLHIMEKLIELRNKKGNNAAIPEEELISMIDALMGEENRRELSQKGIEIEDLEWLLMQIWKRYHPERSGGNNSGGSKNLTSQKSGP